MTHTSPTTRLRSYFWALGLTAVFLLAAVVTCNYWLDPYYLHQWDTPLLQRLSPAQQKIVPWAKTYAAYRYQPEVVYLGSSRAEIGLPTDAPVFRGKRVFNLAISGATLGDAISLLHHTSAFHRPEIVVWGLEYGWQFREKTGNTDLSKDLVAQGPHYPLKRFLLNLKRALSLTMTTDAVRIVFDPSAQQCLPILATYGTKSAQCLEYIMADEGGTPKAFDKIIHKKDPLGHPADEQASLELLETVTRDYCRQGTAFRFFLHPVHALAELSYWETNGQDLDRWKEKIVQLVEARRQEGCDIRLMDFSGYNAITTEAVPQATGREGMQNYWEHSHYRSEVGQQVLARLFSPGPAAEPGGFGADLNGATIQQHLLAFRHNREQYCLDHPQETVNKAACKGVAGKD